jgi:alpha-ketoglutarate-dependent taurine dioxygenase
VQEAVLEIKKLGETVGAEVLGVDHDRLANDDALPGACLQALDENGVLIFRDLHLDDAAQVRFCRRLGEVVSVPSHAVPEITVISLDPGNPLSDYFLGAFEWHIDGTTDDIPSKASVLTAHQVSERGGETEFASTYAAYDLLSDGEREQFASLRVFHTFEASQRKVHPDPTPQQLADWRKRPGREHPLVWEHRSGRRSLVLGTTTERVVGMEEEESRTLLNGLLERATAAEGVFRHTWWVGDTVIWDNRGVLHRGRPYDLDSPRELHRTTLVGDEPIK